MVRVHIRNGRLELEVRGLERLLGLTSHLSVPLIHVRGAEVASDLHVGWWEGLRLPGTHIPGVLAVGTFFTFGKKVFMDIRERHKAVVVRLDGEDYDELMFETEDPAGVVAAINAALPDRVGGGATP